MAVTPIGFAQKLGRFMLALGVTLSLTNTALAVMECISAKRVPQSSCCPSTAAKEVEKKGCCCEVSTTDGHPAVSAKAIGSDELTKVILLLPAAICGWDVRLPSSARFPITRLERPPPQIVVIRIAPKRAPPIA